MTKALTNSTKQKDMIIQKAEKGNAVVILGKESYIEKMEELLSDTSNFERLEFTPEKNFNFIFNSQDKIKNLLKSPHDKESLSDMLCKEFCLLDAVPQFFKIHKPVIKIWPPFRPILDAINTQSYKLAKFLAPNLSPLIINEYTVKDTFAFAEEITKTD